MVAAKRNLHEFKDEILARIEEKSDAFKSNFLAELKD